MSENTSRIGRTIVTAVENTQATNPYADPKITGKRAKRLKEICRRMNGTSRVDMLSQPEVVSSTRVYNGRIFAVDDRRIMLEEDGGRSTGVDRQVIRHPSAAIMLVHNVKDDIYLIEREYRVGPNAYSFGVPAGLVDRGESALMAAFRELREETGIIVPGVPSGTERERSRGLWSQTAVRKAVAASGDVQVETLGSFYSSQGMSDELATLFTIHLQAFSKTERQFDPDEHVQSTWVTWDDLHTLIPFRGLSVNLLVEREELRRLRARLAR